MTYRNYAPYTRGLLYTLVTVCTIITNAISFNITIQGKKTTPSVPVQQPAEVRRRHLLDLAQNAHVVGNLSMCVQEVAD